MCADCVRTSGGRVSAIQEVILCRGLGWHNTDIATSQLGCAEVDWDPDLKGDANVEHELR